MFVEFEKAFLVFSNANILLVYAIPKVNANVCFDAVFFGAHQKPKGLRGVVDVRNYKVGVSQILYGLQHIFYGQAAVIQTIIAMTV